MESFNQRNSLQPLLQRDRIENSSKRDFFPSLFFSPLPRGAKLVTSAENWIVSDTKKRGRGRVDKGQSASLAVPVVSIEITSRRIGKCDGAANGGEKLQSVGNCFIPFPARTQYRASLTRASTFKDFHLSQRWIPTTQGDRGAIFLPKRFNSFPRYSYISIRRYNNFIYHFAERGMKS